MSEEASSLGGAGGAEGGADTDVTDDQLDHLRQLFASWDLDGDGDLSFSELKAGMQETMGPDAATNENIRAAVDEFGHNNLMRFKDFVRLVLSWSQAGGEEVRRSW